MPAKHPLFNKQATHNNYPSLADFIANLLLGVNLRLYAAMREFRNERPKVLK